MNSAQLLRHRKGLLIVANHHRNICERRGRLELSKRWPDGSRFRRPFPNVTAARTMRSRIEAAIAEGTWRDLKDKLALTPNTQPASTSSKDLTLREYAPIYLAEMRRKNRRADFEIQIRNILPVLGEIALKDIRRPDALRYRALRSDGRVAATVNRGV